MSSTLRNLLALYGETAQNSTEKGTYFENVAKVLLENDPLQKQRFDKVWHFRDWASEQELPVMNDTGIDIVARIRGTNDFCAVQCKFYKAGIRLSKSDLDTFFSALGKRHFKERLVINTTDGAWGKFAEDLMRDQSIPTSRISSTASRSSNRSWNARA